MLRFFPRLCLTIFALGPSVGCFYGPLIQNEVVVGAPDAGLDAGGEVDAESLDAGAGTDAASAPDDAGSTVRDGAIALPFVVDEHFPDRSTFGTNLIFTHVEGGRCPIRPGQTVGDCHRLTWNAQRTFTGAHWSIGVNYIGLEDRLIEAGATEVSFYTWSARPGAVVEFGVGMRSGDAEFDGTEDRTTVELDVSPRLHAIQLRTLANYERIYGPFFWVAESRRNPMGLEFYIDGIEWRRAERLPLVVDDLFTGRASYTEDGTFQGHIEDDLCPTRAGAAQGECHRIRWSETMSFAASNWTVGNRASEYEAQPIAAGASQVRFYAWGAQGGEEIEFGAGFTELGLDLAQDGGPPVVLTTSPVQYTVDLNQLSNQKDVYGAFRWRAERARNPSGIEFYIDDIHWVR